jgi:predicted RNA-binding protein
VIQECTSRKENGVKKRGIVGNKKETRGHVGYAVLHFVDILSG